MKYKINATVLLLVILFCSMIQADNSPSQTSTADDDFYGQFDAVYPDELRLIINDKSIDYSNISHFLDSRGNTILNINESIQRGSYIKYHISPTSDSDFLLIDLKIISEEEYNNAKGDLNTDGG